MVSSYSVQQVAGVTLPGCEDCRGEGSPGWPGHVCVAGPKKEFSMIKLDGVAPLVTDPPNASSISCKNHQFGHLQIYISITFEALIQFHDCFGFRMYS